MHATRIVAIRHGETSWNVDARIQGHLDIPLNDVGLWQAQRVGAALADEQFDAIYSSDLQRALATAQAVGSATACPVQPDTGLRERCFGSFEGCTFHEIEVEESSTIARADRAERTRAQVARLPTECRADRVDGRDQSDAGRRSPDGFPPLPHRANRRLTGLAGSSSTPVGTLKVRRPPPGAR